MSTEKETKIKKLLDLHQPGTVLLATWLEKQGFSRDLQARYRRGGWLESVGSGAFKRPGERITWQGGLFAIQQQANLPIHAGAMTALSLQGFAQYLRVGQQSVYLFSPRGTKLPAWFAKHNWEVTITHRPTSLLPHDVGLVDHKEPSFTIRVSGPERAMLECLHLAPKEFDLFECYQVMEGLTSLRPTVAQQLLEASTSVKANRLFLFMAEKANHQWFRFIKTSSIDLGKGGRSLSRGGVYISKYNLVVPQALAGL